MDEIFNWLEKSRLTLENFKTKLQRNGSKQQLLSKLVNILSIDTSTARTPQLAAEIASTRNEMIAYVNELREQKLRAVAKPEEQTITKITSSATEKLDSTVPSSSTSLATEVSPSNDNSPIEVKAENDVATAGPEMTTVSVVNFVQSPIVNFNSIKDQMYELKKLVAYCALTSAEEAYSKAFLLTVKELLRAVHENYLAYKAIPTLSVNEVVLVRSIVSVLASILEDISICMKKVDTPAIVASVTKAITNEKSRNEDSDDSDVDTDLFARKVNPLTILTDLTTAIAIVYAHIESVALKLSREDPAEGLRDFNSIDGSDQLAKRLKC